MQLSSRIILASVLGLCTFPVAACSSDDSCEGTSTCATGASGGTSGNAGSAGSSATGGNGGSAGDSGTCDITKSPSEEGCLVTDEFAVFVSPNGNANATGSQSDPFDSITEAATSASAAGKVVIVCNATYDEHVKITTGAKIYGGFDCSTWAYQSGTRADVAPVTTGYALEIDSVTDSVTIEDVAFKAKDGAAPGESSIAALVKSSPTVTLRRVRLAAGKGINGADGTLAAFTMPAETVLVGANANGAVGGITEAYTCPAGDKTTGGPGGNGGGANGTSGGDGLPSLGGGKGGQAGPTCAIGGTGNPGEHGSDMPGASTLGVVALTGWIPASGSDGQDGKVGQGGGGGSGSSTFGGGGGGNGGCGGAGAKGGQGGGASVGLLAIDSPVEVSNSEIVTADAGNGGKGLLGQPGMTQGGTGGVQSGSGACTGGTGGPGGNGGASGGGAGGVSVGVLYAGTQPSLSATSPVVGQAGKGGLGGKPGVNDGIAGQAVPELQID